MEVTGANTVKSLDITKKIKDFPPLAELKAKLLKENADEAVV